MCADVIKLITRAEAERQRLIAEARANYEHVFPSTPMTKMLPSPIIPTNGLITPKIETTA